MDRIEHLRDIYARVAGQATFTERQHQRRGTLRSDAAVDAALAAVVTEMRERYALVTSLSTSALVAVVRGFFAGRDDDAIAAAVGTTPGVVGRARLGLHLFRDEDFAAPVDLRDLRRRLDSGATHGEAAAALGTSVSTVRRYARVLAASDEARRTGYRYPDEFASALAAAGDLDGSLAATRLAERRLFEEVHD